MGDQFGRGLLASSGLKSSVAQLQLKANLERGKGDTLFLRRASLPNTVEPYWLTAWNRPAQRPAQRPADRAGAFRHSGTTLDASYRRVAKSLGRSAEVNQTGFPGGKLVGSMEKTVSLNGAKFQTAVEKSFALVQQVDLCNYQTGHLFGVGVFVCGQCEMSKHTVKPVMKLKRYSNKKPSHWPAHSATSAVLV